MTKVLYVSSPVQAALLKEVIFPEMRTGFWKDHRPSDHATQWLDVQVVVSETDQLGAAGFKVPRLYNFVNPGFIKPNEVKLVQVAQVIKETSNFRSVKKELIELSRIVGGRLTGKNEIPIKANRGNSKAGSAQETVTKAKTAIKNATASVKKTVVKRTDPNITIQKTTAGASVWHTPVPHDHPAEPTIAD